MAIKSFTFNSIIRSPNEAERIGFNRSDPFYVAAITIHALMIYKDNRDDAIEFINYLKGPEKVSEYQKQFIRDRFMDKGDYFIRSYFKGAVPENNYTPDIPYTLVVSDNPYSYVNNGYAKLFITNGGSDSPREIVLREKKSTGEWFLWQYEGLLLGIKMPVKEDLWC